MSDNDWDNGYAKSLGVLLNGSAISTPDAFGGRVVDDSFLLLFNASELDLPWTLPADSLWAAPNPWMVELDTALALVPGTEYGADSPPTPEPARPCRCGNVPSSFYARRHDGRRTCSAARGELGVETFYWDDEGHRHESNLESIATVVEILEADYARSRRSPSAPVIVGQPGSVHVGDGVDQVQVRLADGTDARRARRRRARHDRPDPLPVGSHDLSLDRARHRRDLDDRDRAGRDAPLGTARRAQPACSHRRTHSGSATTRCRAISTSRRSAGRCPGSVPTCS